MLVFPRSPSSCRLSPLEPGRAATGMLETAPRHWTTAYPTQTRRRHGRPREPGVHHPGTRPEKDCASTAPDGRERPGTRTRGRRRTTPRRSRTASRSAGPSDVLRRALTGFFRAPMRTRLDGVDPDLALERALRLASAASAVVCPLRRVRSRGTRRTADEYDERTARRLERLRACPTARWCGPGTRTACSGWGAHWAWSYDAGQAAYDADLVNVRDCAWDANPRASTGRRQRSWRRTGGGGGTSSGSALSLGSRDQCR